MLSKHTPEKSDLKLYIGDLTVRLETSRRQDQGETEAGSLFKARSISTAHDTVIDMKQYKGGQHPADSAYFPNWQRL